MQRSSDDPFREDSLMRLKFQYGLNASKLDFLHSCLDFFALNDFAGLKPAQTNQAHTKGGHWTHF